MSLAQGNNTPIRPRIESWSPDPDSDALTTRPVCPQRLEVFVKIQNKIFFFFFFFFFGGGGGRGEGSGWEGQDGCYRRIEFFGKIHKKWGGGSGGRVGLVWRVRVDVNEEYKFLWKFK